MLELLPHIPFLVLMSSFYSFITLNTELKMKNNVLEKFLQGFTAHGGATMHEYALCRLHSHVSCFHVFLIKHKKRSEEMVLIRSFPRRVVGVCSKS